MNADGEEAADGRLHIRVLGPFRVERDGVEIDLKGPKPRLLLAMLTTASGTVVSVDQLIDGLWGDEPPPSARKAVQVNVSRLRQELGGDGHLKTVGKGYVLQSVGLEVDAAAFEAVVDAAPAVCRTDPEGASSALQAALATWRGRPYGDLGGESAMLAEVRRLEELRLRALELRIEADLRLGRHGALVGELEILTAEHPYREELRALQMLVLYRSGRQADALRVYSSTREMLIQELGIEPSPRLKNLEHQILEQAPDLGPEFHGEGPVLDGSRVVRGYELREPLGEGSFGIVHRAYQASVGREVAIKVIRSELADHPEFVRRFEAEAQFIARLQHPHIVSLHDYWREPGNAYLVMDLLRGGSLAGSLENGPWDPPAALRMVDQVGSALGYAHRLGVVHRDVKPANVLLDGDANAYLADFGIAIDPVGGLGEVHPDSVAYVAPEELAGERADHRADIYCLGLLVVETLGGTRPALGGRPDPIHRTRPDLPAALDDVLSIATAGDPGERFERVEDLLRALRQVFGSDIVAPGPPASPAELRNPFKGLRAFTETDARDFFGREALVEELLEQVLSAPLTAAVGPSGCGKSSVVKAGVIPALRRRSEGDWLVAELFPGSYPFEELEAALLRVATENTARFRDELLADERGLLRVAKRVLPDDDAHLLLVVDQFEELFTLCADESTRQLFLASLLALARDERSRVHVLLTMRADFLDRPLAYGEFGELLRAHLVAVAMPARDSLALAISQPARVAGLELEPGLVSAISNDVDGEPGGLPLLQHALSELFEQRENRRLTLAAYEQSGRVQGALARRAEQIHSDLPERMQDVARQVFLRLVRTGEGTDDTRRRILRSAIESLDLDRGSVDEVLARFGAFRLLTFDRDPTTRSPTVEVAHESLIREWPRLRGWVDEYRQDLATSHRLDAMVKEWEANDRNSGYLIRKGRLERFEDFAGSTSLSFTEAEREFLAAARAAEDENEFRARVRRRVTLAMVSMAAVIAGALAVFAFGEREDARDAAALAERTAALARAGQLEVAALLASEEDPEVGLHVALESDAIRDAVGQPDPDLGSLATIAFRDRLAARMPAVTPDRVRAVREEEWISADGTVGLLATGERGFPTADPRLRNSLATAYVVVTIPQGEVLERFEEPTGFADGWWDPVTGEIALTAWTGGITWYDPSTFEPTREIDVPPETWATQRVDDMLSYALITDAGNIDLQTHVVDLATGEELAKGKPDAWYGRVSPDGRYLAILDDFAHVRVYDVGSGGEDPISSFSVNGVSIHAAGWDWSIDGDSFFVTLESGLLYEVDAATAEVLQERIVGPGGLIAASPDGALLAVSGRESQPLIVSTDGLQPITDLAGLRERAYALSWTADSRTLVAEAFSGETLVWDLGERTTAPHTLPGLRPGLAKFAFLEEGLVMAGGFDGGATVVDPGTGEVVHEHQLAGRVFDREIVANPAGTTMAVPAGEGVRVVDAVTGETVGELAGQPRPLAFSPDGELLLAGVPEPTWETRFLTGYRIRDVGSGEIVAGSEEDPNAFVRAMAGVFTPDGEQVVVATDRGVFNQSTPELGSLNTDGHSTFLEVHDVATGQMTHQIHLSDSGAPVAVVEVAISPDGRRLALLDQASNLTLYDLDTLLETWSASEAWLGRTQAGRWAVTFSEDSSLLLHAVDGGIVARTADSTLEIQWSVDLGGEEPPFLVVRDGIVWANTAERIFWQRGSVDGLVGFPLDRAAMVDHAVDSLTRELHEDECRQHLGLDGCENRLFIR